MNLSHNYHGLEKVLVIDLGLKDLMIFSKGEKRKPINRLTKIEHQIAKLNKKIIKKSSRV